MQILRLWVKWVLGEKEVFGFREESTGTSEANARRDTLMGPELKGIDMHELLFIL